VGLTVCLHVFVSLEQDSMAADLEAAVEEMVKEGWDEDVARQVATRLGLMTACMCMCAKSVGVLVFWVVVLVVESESDGSPRFLSPPIPIAS
jgi:hypothetical protein